MTKPARVSPVLGYNHNLRYRGRLFHVQTEDSGPGNPHLYTHLFYEGTILSSKKHEYDGESPEETVKALMQGLHKAMIRELTRGEHDQKVIAFFAARGEEAYSEPPPPAPAVPAAAAPQPAAAPAAPAASVPAAPAASTPGSTPPPYVVQISGVIEGAPAPAQRPAPAAASVVASAPAAAPRRPNGARPAMVVVKPTDLKRMPMAFGQSADGVVVQRSAAGGGTAKVPVAAVRAQASTAAPISSRGAAGAPPRVARGRTPSPIDKPFSELVSDKSLDDVILEYLSDDGEPQKR
jgi:hypothetical protein